MLPQKNGISCVFFSNFGDGEHLVGLLLMFAFAFLWKGWNAVKIKVENDVEEEEEKEEEEEEKEEEEEEVREREAQRARWQRTGDGKRNMTKKESRQVQREDREAYHTRG